MTGSAIEGRHGVAKEELEASLPDPGLTVAGSASCPTRPSTWPTVTTVGKEWDHHEAIHALVTGLNDDLADEGHSHRVTRTRTADTSGTRTP